MKHSWKAKTIGILLLIALYIFFPFFKIKFFETDSAIKLIYHNFLIPMLIFVTVGTIITYVKYLRKLNKQNNSKIKVVFQDLFTVTLLTCFVSTVLFGLTLSTIITSNVYLGQSKNMTINAIVESYEPYRTKWGRLRHYITFINPLDNSSIRLEVYRKYENGEVFNKAMKIGKWGQLYSFD